MLNLLHWRQRVARQRTRWLLRWCAMLAVSLGIVTGSIALTLDRLKRDLPDQGDAVDALRQTNQSLLLNLEALERSLVQRDATQQALKEAEKWALGRMMDWNRWFSNRPVRLLSIEQTPRELKLQVQVASLAVLSDVIEASAAEVLSVRSADSGQVIEIRVHATEGK